MISIENHIWGKSPAVDRVWADVAGMRATKAGDRILVLLQAFMDESIEPGGEFILGGYVSTVSRWAALTSEWDQALKNFGTLKESSGDYHFKFSDMYTSERASRIPVFRGIADRNTIMAISCRINMRELKSAMSRVSTAPGFWVNFGRYANPYLFAFYGLMDSFHAHRREVAHLFEPDASIDFIFDEQIKEQKQILAAWCDFVDERPSEVRHLYGSAPIFRRDDEYLPLQAADLWAGAVRQACVEKNLEKVLGRGDSSLYSMHISFNESDIVGHFLRMLANWPDAAAYDNLSK